MDQSRVVILTIVALIGAHAAAQAGPCTTQIAQLQKQIGRSATGPEGGPSGPQSIGAQLHHQPTPGAVQNAESRANADAAAAVDSARRADAAGDADGCRKALEEARRLYGID
jgi:hypothetical protein